MIQEIISDMIPFLIVLIYSIFTFALVFCVLSEMSEQKTIEEAWRHSYLINYGEFDTDLYTWLEWVVFVMATCLNPLILMNMLIALMGDTYSRVKEKADVADLREMALFIFEFESILVWRREKGRKKYFQLCTVSELEDEEEMDIKKFWQDKITLLTQNVWRLHNEVTEMELKYESSNKSVHQGLEDINSNLKIKVEAIEKKMKSTQQELLDILNRTADR